MKRYILLNALTVLFFSAMSFGMQEETKSPLNFKFKPGEKTKQKKFCYGLIAQDVQSPEENALQQTVMRLKDNLRRMPTVKEVIIEKERESFVSLLSNDEQFMNSLEKTNEILMKHCVEQHKKFLEIFNETDIR